MYWTESTLGFLIAGIFPLIIAGFQVAREGFTGFLSLRFLSIAFIWWGYHFSPLISYLFDIQWKTFLLVPYYVDAGLCFSTLSMCCVLVGGDLLRLRSSGIGYPYTKRARKIRTFSISNRWLLLVLFLNLVLFVINIGGIENVWIASYGRGEGQFEQRAGIEKLLHISRVLSMPLSVLFTSIATLSIAQTRKKASTLVLGCLILISASLESIHFFSRAAGFPLMIFAFLVLLIKRERGIGLASVAVVIALFLGSVGLHHRSYYSPGLYNFLKAVREYKIISITDETRFFIGPEDNPLDAMAPWTRKALLREQEASKGESMDLAGRLLWNLHPFPSELIPVRPLGRDLSEVMGTWGQFRITTPAMAELYYVFGMPGALFFILLGRMYLFFDKRFSSQPDIGTTVCLLLCFVSFPIGLHSGLRAMTRPLLYSLVIYYYLNNKRMVAYKLVDRRNARVRL